MGDTPFLVVFAFVMGVLAGMSVALASMYRLVYSAVAMRFVMKASRGELQEREEAGGDG